MTPDDRAAIERAVAGICHALPAPRTRIYELISESLSPLLSARDARIGELEEMLEEANHELNPRCENGSHNWGVIELRKRITAALSPPAETKEQEHGT